MTTGRINQVRTVGGAGAPAAPRPGGPDGSARAPRGPASRRALSSFVGGRAAPARSGRLRTPGRVSPRLGGARLGPGRGPSGPGGVAPAGTRSPTPGLRRPRLAGPRPRLLLSPSRSRSERRRRHASSCGAPLGTVRPRTVTRTKACDPSAAASALPLGRPPPARNTSRLRGGHRSPHAPGPSRRDGAPAPGYGRPWPAACRGRAPPSCGAVALAAARGPAAVSFAC